MKLLTYKTQDTEPRLGFIHNNQVIDMQDFGDVSNFPLPNDMLELIDMGFEIIAEITELVADTPAEFFEEISYELPPPFIGGSGVMTSNVATFDAIRT